MAMLYEPDEYTNSDQRYARWVISTIVITTILMMAGLVLAHLHTSEPPTGALPSVGRHISNNARRHPPAHSYLHKGQPYLLVPAAYRTNR